MASQRLLEGIQHKLMMKLLEFDYTIEYKKGCHNKVADALSRRDQPTDSCQAISTTIPSWLVEVESSYVGDQKCMELLQDLSLDHASHPNYTLKSGILRYKNKIYIGNATDLKQKLFQAFHASSFGGHSGQRVTLHRQQHIFFWPNLQKIIADQVAQCLVCQISKTEKSSTQDC